MRSAKQRRAARARKQLAKDVLAVAGWLVIAAVGGWTAFIVGLSMQGV